MRYFFMQVNGSLLIETVFFCVSLLVKMKIFWSERDFLGGSDIIFRASEVFSVRFFFMSGNWYKFFCCGFFFVNVRVFGGGDFFWNEIF